MKSWCHSFGCAARGIAVAVRGERNMRFHLAAAFYVLILGWLGDLSRGEWTAILLCIGGVLASECLNTAVERLCDAVHPEKDPRIRDVKDMAAGAVLVLAAAAALVGGVVFFQGERVRRLLALGAAYPAAAAALAVLAVPLGLWVFWPRKK